MTNFASRNKAPLTFLIIIFWAVLSFIDYKIEDKSSTTIQWLLFAVMVIGIGFIHFISASNEIEYTEEHYPTNNGGFPIPGFEGDPQVGEIIEEPVLQYHEHYHDHGNRDAAGNLIAPVFKDHVKQRMVYIVQPINVTEEEFNEKINPQINMERKSAKELKPATEKLVPIVTYGLTNIPQKFKAMYGDICNFATSGEPKTEDEITKKIMGYGRPYTAIRPEDGLVAFEIENGIRLPEAGYFGVK